MELCGIASLMLPVLRGRLEQELVEQALMLWVHCAEPTSSAHRQRLRSNGLIRINSYFRIVGPRLEH